MKHRASDCSPGLPNATGFCRLRAFLDNSLDTNRSAWASLNLSLGTVVSLTATPDVGDDKNTITAKRAKLHFTRTGSLANSLTVSFLLPTNGLASPVDNRNLMATYGTGVNGDYTLIATGGATLGTVNPGGTTTLTIPSGSAEAIVDIAPKADNLTEANVVRVTLNPDSSYAIGAASNADVYIYDGPYWTLYPLAATVGLDYRGYPLDTTAYAISGNSTTTQIAGVVTNFGALYTTNYGLAGAWWNAGNYSEPTGVLVYYSYTNNNYYGPHEIPYSISDAGQMVGVQQPVNGSDVFHAFRASSIGSLVTLPPLNGTSSYGAGAYAINPNGTFTVGYSFNGSTNRPVYWGASGNATDLGETSATNRTGVAYGINVSNIVVGVYEQTFRSVTRVQGFRTVYNAAAPVTIQGLANDVLLPPVAYSTNQTVALSMNSSGTAAGYYQIDNRVSAAAIWLPRNTGTTNSAALEGGRWQNPLTQNYDPRSQFTAVNDSNWAVGWSGDGSIQRAVVSRGIGVPMVDLNDRHFLYGGSGWTLNINVGINSKNWIIGNGISGSLNRGFILVPRSPGQ